MTVDVSGQCKVDEKVIGGKEVKELGDQIIEDHVYMAVLKNYNGCATKKSYTLQGAGGSNLEVIDD